MDREEEELQSLGFFGIFKESFKIIFKWKKIFSQITLALILPLSFIFLAHFQISQLLFCTILQNHGTLADTQVGSPQYSNLSKIISSEWIAFCLFKFAYCTFFLILSLLSTSAVVYTVASIYTAKEITFKKTISVVPKVWKRLMVTFFWNFVIVFWYNIAAIIFFFFGVLLIGVAEVKVLIIGIITLILYLSGLVYISILWHLASVVSVLEDVESRKAMVKSKCLIKGKLGVAATIFLILIVCFIGIVVMVEIFIVLERLENILSRIGFGILCVLLLSKLILFGLVIQTVIYFVCKSYHHENIDKSSLADHLEGYLGDYVTLKSKNIQMEQIHV